LLKLKEIQIEQYKNQQKKIWELQEKQERKKKKIEELEV